MKTKNRISDRLLAVLVRRRPEIMDRLTGLLRRRGFKTLGISAGRAKENDLLRLTVQVSGDDRCLEQMQKQLYKITETVKVVAIDPQRHVRREVALIKIRGDAGVELQRLAEEFSGRVIDCGAAGVIVELSGHPQAIDRFIGRLNAGAIVEIARSGIVAMETAWQTH